MFMVKKIFFIAFLVIWVGMQACFAVEMTVEEIRIKIVNTKSELQNLYQVEPKTPEIQEKITMLEQKVANLKTMEVQVSESQDATTVQAVIQQPKITPKITPRTNIGKQDVNVESGSNSSTSKMFSDPTVLAAVISAGAVVATTLIGIFAKRRS